MKKTKFAKGLVYALVVFCVLALILFWRGDIGLSQRGMEKNYLLYGQNGHSFLRAEGEKMTAYLSYSQDRTEMDVDVYVKRRGAIGWFFRYGGATSSVSGPIDKVALMRVEGNEEMVLVCNRPEGVSRIEILADADTRKTIYPEEGKPSVHILKETWEVTVYGPDGQVLQVEERKL